MHFLCLHGRGTNSKVFQVQTAALRYELGDEHTYTFLEGTVPCVMAPEIKDLSEADAQHFEYYDPANAKSYLQALEALEVYIRCEGPFDAVLGFSQGAGLALMFLVKQAHLRPNIPPDFKALALFSRIGVYDPVAWVETGQAYILERPPPGVERLNIPVAAIWGSNDWDAVRVENKTTKAFIDEDCLWEFVHEGSHEVPGASMPESVREAVKVIRRAVTQASITDRDK